MERWAGIVSRHPRRIILAWVVFTGFLLLFARSFGGELTDAFTLPGAESQRAQDLLSEVFPSEAGIGVHAVFRAPSGSIDQPRYRQAIEAFQRRAARVDEVVAVENAWETPGSIAPDGRTALVNVRYGAFGRELDSAHVQKLLDLAEAPRAQGLIVEFVGEPVRELETEEARLAEIVGIGVALIVLLLAFGSVLAAGMPIITALVALALGTVLIVLAATQLDIVTIAPMFGAMLGIGVGIDYALFVISRFREQLGAGQPVSEAVRIAVNTAGRAVAFAGIIVVVALLGLFFIGIPLVANLGLSAAFVVLMEMLVAVSLLPAMLRLVGHRIDKFSIPGLRYTAGGERGRWYRFSRRIERRPLLWLGAATAILVLLAVPVVDMQIGVADDGNLPDRYTSRRGYDLIADAYGPGVNATLIAVTQQAPGASPEALERVRRSLARLDGVASVLPARTNEDSSIAVFTVFPTSAPQAPETRRLVERLRDQGAPGATQAFGSEMVLYVSGRTAVHEDVTARMLQRLPIFFGVVIGLSILLLMMAFRSILVPLKAALMNMLAISASLGVVVIVFQWGWGISLLGLDRTGPVESFLPMFMFAVLFGLSMDYEVFLLSRVRERWIETGDSAESVAHGIGASARVITAAAAILAAVFLSFAFFGQERTIKEFGIGMAFAIIVDATVVRLVLVPAFMQLAGNANWWMPAWLDRILPNISIDPPLKPIDAPPGPVAIPARPPLMEPAPAPWTAAADQRDRSPSPVWGSQRDRPPATVEQVSSELIDEPAAAQPQLAAAPEPEREQRPADQPEGEALTVRGLVTWAAFAALTACAFIVGLLLGSTWTTQRR